MDMRTRILPKMLNSEVQEYLKRNDIIIVPVGTVEMHGGFPLDCETVISEAYALKMAEECGSVKAVNVVLLCTLHSVPSNLGLTAGIGGDLHVLGLGQIAGDAADVGPKSGFGFFYHLTDSLSLRFDADATLGLDGKQEMRYTLTGGVQWSF